MKTNSHIQIRAAATDDREFIISLLPRLTEFGPPPWRDVRGMLDTDTQVLNEALVNPSVDTAFFLAVDKQGIRLGFVHLEAGRDYYNHEAHGHIANLIVAPEAEGRGAGRLLLEKAEDWVRARGFRWLTLSVFAQNTRAREVYRRFGYGADIMKYVKELD
jgi:ribosomal protein S18 acetylase RimI-like enzyme